MAVQSRKSASTQLSGSRSTVWHTLEKPLTGLLLTLALMLSAKGLPNEKALSAEIPATVAGRVQSSLTSDSNLSQQVLPNGTYTYGQSPNAEQIGSTYLVFEVERDRIIGAFYMPQSSFDCFQGEVQANELALTITDSYEQMTYPYRMAMEPTGTVAEAGGAIAPLTLTGYHQLSEVSDTDHHILAQCKAHYQ